MELQITPLNIYLSTHIISIRYKGKEDTTTLLYIRKVMSSALYQLTKKPLVGWITMQGIVKTCTYFCSIDCSLQVAINVTALVGFSQQIVEVPHGDSSFLTSKLWTTIVTPAHSINLTVSNQ